MLELLLKGHRPAKYKENERVPNDHGLAGGPHFEAGQRLVFHPR
jgi:hypothetical protein